MSDVWFVMLVIDEVEWFLRWWCCPAGSVIAKALSIIRYHSNAPCRSRGRQNLMCKPHQVFTFSFATADPHYVTLFVS